MPRSRPFRLRKRLRLKDFDYRNPSYVYFLTLCARHLLKPFENFALAKQVVEALVFIRKAGNGRIYCYCLMPDHLHIALSPYKESFGVSQMMHQFKSYTTRSGWEFGIPGKLWQKSFYDHIARSDEDLLSICQYILENPVRKGLVEKAADWEFSGMWDPLPI